MSTISICRVDEPDISVMGRWASVIRSRVHAYLRGDVIFSSFSPTFGFDVVIGFCGHGLDFEVYLYRLGIVQTLRNLRGWPLGFAPSSSRRTFKWGALCVNSHRTTAFGNFSGTSKGVRMVLVC